MARNLKDAYILQVEDYNKDIYQILKGGFGLENDEIYYLLCDEEKENYKFTCQELKHIFR